MATPTYSINGGTQVHGVEAGWQRVPLRHNDDGTVTWSDWARHMWRAAVMETATYLEFQAVHAAGGLLSSIETNDIDDRNTNATYTDAQLVKLNGNHLGRNVVNVAAEFRVKTQ
jgi:hypothetical protein